MVRCPGETEITIFRLLSKYIKDSSLAKKFVDILLPFLSKRVIGSGKNLFKNYSIDAIYFLPTINMSVAGSADVSLEAMQVLRDIIPVSGSGSTKQILNAVSPLLVTAEMDMRLCICELLEVLAKSDPSTLVVVIVVRLFIVDL